jgi:hypothetical protein
MKGVAEAPLAYAGLGFCLIIGVFILYGRLTQVPGDERAPSKLAARRKRSVLRRMGFSAKDD